MNDNDKFKEIDELLGGLLPSTPLQELFERKLLDLGMAETAVRTMLGIGYKPLKRILAGTEKTVDLTLLFKLSDFLQMDKDLVVRLYIESLEKNLPAPAISPDKIKFIKENFDLVALKKARFINGITNFKEIEKRLIGRLGLKSILEYRRPTMDIAFSSGKFKPEKHLTRAFWISSAISVFREIDNTNEYSRDRLIKFFPQIKWHSINEERGLLDVMRQLHKIGVTVVYQPSLPGLQLRGATFVVGNKPCIVLTNYMGFYPTLWFALIHELYHVLYDLDEIRESRYHMTDDSNDQLSVLAREEMADNFAREYLFSKEKMEYLRPYFSDANFVYRFAIDNHVHPSIVYAIKAFQSSKLDQRKAWQRVRKHYSEANFKSLADTLGVGWTDDRPIELVLNEQLATIYNH